MTTDPKYTSEAHRAAAADENAPEGKYNKPFRQVQFYLTDFFYR